MTTSMFELWLILQGMIAIELAPATASANAQTIPVDMIHFIVVNHDGCPFDLEATTSVLDLENIIAYLYNISFPVRIQLLGKTIPSSKSLVNLTIAEIPSIISLANDLYEIWGDGFLIPLTISKLPSEEDIAVYISLSLMFRGPDTNIHEFEWHQFISQCVWSESCVAQELCDKFYNFHCEDGKLIVISLAGRRITGSLDLVHLPSSVQKILVERNLLTEILGIEYLVGKQLMFLDIRNNPVDIDLELFDKRSIRSIGNPIKILRVSPYQVSWYLLGKRPWISQSDVSIHQLFTKEVDQALTHWMSCSTLDSIYLGRKRSIPHDPSMLVQVGLEMDSQRRLAGPLDLIVHRHN